MTAVMTPPLPRVDPAPGRAVILFDGDCPFCRKSMRILKRLDWLNRLHCQNARETESLPPCTVPLDSNRLIEEMHVVPADRTRAYAGYAAFRWMAWRLPLVAWLAPLLYIPGIPWIGDRIYKWIAKNRFGLVPCDDGGCRVPLRK
jgi:predicted DCC family thiol-disulfide oxidoreductase YuxK